MVSKVPASSNKAFPAITEIIRMGEIDIPNQFQGNGAPGNTLEYLLDLKVNNNDSPDLHDWEIKFHGGISLLTLFHKDPLPKGIINKVVDRYGWEDHKGRISFRHTIQGKSPKGFIVESIENKITVTNINDYINGNEPLVPYWEHNTILNAIGAKLRRLILVHGVVNKTKRTVQYNNAVAFWDLDMMGISESIKNGTIYIDFDARTNGERGTSIRNHGTKFRIHINDIRKIYENHKIIQ